QLQQQLWQQRQAQTSEWLGALTRRATQLQETLTRLAEIRKTWRQTRAAAVAADAPGAILTQIDGALAAIEVAEAPVGGRRGAVVDRESVIAKEVARSADLLARFTQTQQAAVGGILIRDGSPLWVTEAWSDARATLGARIGELFATRRNDVIRYVQDPSRGMPLHAAILVVLVIVFVVARRPARRPDAPEDGDATAATVFDRPYAAALAVTLIFVSAPVSTVPQSVRKLDAEVSLVRVVRR